MACVAQVHEKEGIAAMVPWEVENCVESNFKEKPRTNLWSEFCVEGSSI